MPHIHRSACKAWSCRSPCPQGTHTCTSGNTPVDLTRYKSTNLGRFDLKLARLHASPMAFPGSWPAEPAKCLVVAKSTDVAFFLSLAFLNDLKVSKSSVGTAEETQSLSWKQQGTPAERNAATRTSLHRCSCCLCPPFPSVGIRIAVVPAVGSGGGGRGGCGAQCLHGLRHGCYHRRSGQ